MKIYCNLLREMIAKPKSVIFFFIILFSFMTYGCTTNETKPEIEELKIGNQIWMKKNLDIDTFRNGDKIMEVKSLEEFIHVTKNKTPAWCYYKNDSSNGPNFGKLYNWYAVNDTRGITPLGWKIPSQSDWDTLTKHLAGGKNPNFCIKQTDNEKGPVHYALFAGKDVGLMMKSKSSWIKHNNNSGNGNNKSGFNGLPGGYRDGESGIFYDIFSYGAWWSSDEQNNDYAWFRGLSNGHPAVCIAATNKTGFISIRCLKE